MMEDVLPSRVTCSDDGEGGAACTVERSGEILGHLHRHGTEAWEALPLLGPAPRRNAFTRAADAVDWLERHAPA